MVENSKNQGGGHKANNVVYIDVTTFGLKFLLQKVGGYRNLFQLRKKGEV